MQILDTGMDSNMTICGLLKDTILSFCKENYENSDIDIDGIICVSFRNSFQQHVVHIHDKVIKGEDRDVSTAVISQNGENFNDTANDFVFKKSENCCYACIRERGDNSNIKHKNLNSRLSKGISKLATKKGPPPLYNSKTLCFADGPRLFENEVHVSRFKNDNLHQNRRKSQTKVHQPLKNVSSNQGENYTSSEMYHPVGNCSVTKEHYQQGVYRESESHFRKEESESTNQRVDDKISRAVCIENDENSQRDKVVVKLELMDSENEEDFRVTLNSDESEQLSSLDINEGEKYVDEMSEFCKEKDTGIKDNPIRDNTQNDNFEEDDDKNSNVSHSEDPDAYQDEDVKFDIDNLAHHINAQSEALQSELVSTDTVLKDIRCITTDNDCMQLVNTAAGDRDFFHSNHGNWDSYNNTTENAGLDGSFSFNMNSDALTARPNSDCLDSNQQSINSQTLSVASGRTGAFQNHPPSGYKVNVPHKLHSKRFLPLQKLRHFGNMKTNTNSSILMPFRKSKMLLKTELGNTSQDQIIKEKKYHCKHCGMGFTTTGNKTRHERTTCGKSVYKCDFCQAFFSRSDSKARHMLVRHGVSVTG